MDKPIKIEAPFPAYAITQWETPVPCFACDKTGIMKTVNDEIFDCPVCNGEGYQTIEKLAVLATIHGDEFARPSKIFPFKGDGPSFAARPRRADYD